MWVHPTSMLTVLIVCFAEDANLVGNAPIVVVGIDVVVVVVITAAIVVAVVIAIIIAVVLTVVGPVGVVLVIFIDRTLRHVIFLFIWIVINVEWGGRILVNL